MIAPTLAQQSNPVATFLPLVLMVAVFYFLLIRPQQRRARQQRELVESIDVGDEVVTIGGIYGVVTEVDDETVTLDVGGGSRIRFVKQAVARKTIEEEEAAEEEADEEQ